MTDNKKARERQFLDKFLSNYPEFPEGEIIDFESPDFWVKQNTKILGVEIVNFIRGQNQGESVDRRNEILWQKIADEARKKFAVKFDIPLTVHFFWHSRYNLRQSEISQLADSAVSLIGKYIPEKLFGSVRIDYNEINTTLLKKVCRSISVLKVRDVAQSSWSSMITGWTEVQTDEIQYLLDLKKDKVEAYLQNCDMVWLIIVADGEHISSTIDISVVKEQVYKTSFEKVFVYDYRRNGIFQLELQDAK